MPFTPAEISSKDFIITLRGYDKEEVRAFLDAIAADYEAALAAATEAEAQGGTGYEQLGAELGYVLQAAKESADGIRKKADQESEALRRRATEEAKKLREATTKAAARLKEEAEKHAAEVRSEAEAHSTRARAEADRYSTQIRGNAQKEAEEFSKAAAQRVQRLQSAETRIRERLFAIESLIQEARQEVATPDELPKEGEDPNATKPKLHAAPEPTSGTS